MRLLGVMDLDFDVRCVLESKVKSDVVMATTMMIEATNKVVTHI